MILGWIPAKDIASAALMGASRLRDIVWLLELQAAGRRAQVNRFLMAACLLPLAGAAHAQSRAPSAAMAARIKAMAEIPSTFGAVYSPDGKRIAFISNRTGTPQVWLVGAAGGEPKQITRSTDTVGALAWSPVSDTIAYEVARGGGFNAQVFLSKPDGTEAKRITSGGKEDNFAGAFAR